jgi:hypothetical protein
MAKRIDGSTTIQEVAHRKGDIACKMMDEFFGMEKCCDRRATLTLEFAAILKGKLDKLPELLEALNNLPDVASF